MTSEQEISIRILEAIAPVLAARTNQVHGATESWKDDTIEALDEMYEHAARLVFAKKAKAGTVDPV